MAISTHALMWSATTYISRGNPVKSFQLTRSCGARRSLLSIAFMLTIISTHALMWSATVAVVEHSPRQSISTHALMWSATNV